MTGNTCISYISLFVLTCVICIIIFEILIFSSYFGFERQLVGGHYMCIGLPPLPFFCNVLNSELDA